MIHGKKAAILLRGELLQRWCDEGQMKVIKERSVAVKVGSMTLISTYIPVDTGANEDDIEETWEEVRNLMEWAGRHETLIIGGDFNAHIGRGEDKPMCGMFGLRESNRQGRKMVERMEENGLVYVNSFYNHKRRGT